MAFKSASGYGGLEATPLARVGYYNKIIARVWERDFLPEIVNSEIDERIMRCNQKVQFLRQPEVGPWRRYEKNQELIPNQLTPEAFCMEICNAAYNDIKIDKMDVQQACDRWADWEAGFLDSTYQSLTSMWREWVLNAMILETAPDHKNNAAGRYGNIDLGSVGNPLQVTPQNIQKALARLRRVLQESHRWVEGKMFIVLPVAVYEVLVSSQYANASWAGDCVPCSMAIDGVLPKTLMGFRVIVTTDAPSSADPSGEVAYFIIAGYSEAFAFAGDIIEGRLVEPVRTFGIEYQMLAIWGGRMIYPDAMAIGYWTLGE